MYGLMGSGITRTLFLLFFVGNCYGSDMCSSAPSLGAGITVVEAQARTEMSGRMMIIFYLKAIPKYCQEAISWFSVPSFRREGSSGRKFPYQ